jgi:hypothetical protein
VPSSRSNGQAQRAPRGAPQSQTAAARPRPERVSRTLPASKIRWDRKFRAVMIAVFMLVGWIGLKAGLTLMETHSQANAELQLVSNLAAKNHALERQKLALSQRSTIIRDARALGMVGANERSFVVTGLKLPGNS